MLKISGLSKSLGDFALKSVSFDVPEGEYFALLGASGVGKTVLLELITGLTTADSGSVELNGIDITNESIQKRNIALVYQDQALFPHMNVRRNIAYGLKARGARAEVNDRVDALAAELGVEGLLSRKPATLSGGEAQRVAIARALATDPSCLLLDEPISALDVHARSEMRAMLRRIHRRGQTIIHITHDYEEALSLGSIIGVMEDGSIAQTGTPQEVFGSPRSEFVARFIGMRNICQGTLTSPSTETNGVASFSTSGPTLSILTDVEAGPGMIMFRSEDVTISDHEPQSSARNAFPGTVVDMEPSKLGSEAKIDIGIDVWASVTPESARRLRLERGRRVWVTFKATALRFLPK